MALILAATALPSHATTQTVSYSGYAGFSSITYQSQFYGFASLVNRPLTEGVQAYDYAVKILHTGEDTGYRKRAFWLGRWKQSAYGYDGDHILQITSGDGAPNTWSMWYGHPDVYVGWEEFGANTWWAGNIGDPNVVFNPANNTWIMLAQRQIDAGMPCDYGGTALMACDRIQYLSSGNCAYPWSKKTDRGVVINLTDPRRTALHHPELIYVSGDAQPWWLYVGASVNGVNLGYQRMKSADPTTFDWNTRETSNQSQLGNQIGYLNNCPGGRLFMRITFVDNGAGRTVPSMQISRDGLNWDFGANGPLKMEGSTDNLHNKNCYFLGMSTMSGQGPIYFFGGNHWQVLYGATTANSPGGSDILYSEIGSGQANIYVNP
ncbi:hypothetical protein [Pedosphaera parvula]|uniref:hypothetical protein n=1 Tax=Pedosphaera parvula TaxID=1032527 RepID=UPI00123763FF|nr:hypothetical protein [Pedosphaera parvula]